MRIQWSMGAMALVALNACSAELEVLDDDGTGGAQALEHGTAGDDSGGAFVGCSVVQDTDDVLDLFAAALDQQRENWLPSGENEADCPDEPPVVDDPCPPELWGPLHNCSYHHYQEFAGPEYVGCACQQAIGAEEPSWSCVVFESGGVVMPEPQAGDSCSGRYNGTTNYTSECWCEQIDEEHATWNCSTREELLAGMRAIEPTRPVAALSAEERWDWCRWFEMESLPTALAPVSEDGCTFNTGFRQGTLSFNSARYPQLVASQCVANLALSSCDAPLAQLTDCVDSIRNNVPSPVGCAPYLDTPGCVGTIILKPDDPNSEICPVRVR